MPTDNRRVAAYLPKEIDERLKLFKLERGFTTEEKLGQKESDADSQAIITILSEFFGVSQLAAHSVAHLGNFENLVTIEHLQRLEAEIERLNSKFEEIDKDSNLPSELPEELLVRLNKLEGRVNLLETSESSEGTLSTGELAKRLGVDHSTLSHKKKDKSSEELADWTRSKDPDKVGWRYIKTINRFRPESESSSVFQGELLTENVFQESDEEKVKTEAPSLSLSQPEIEVNDQADSISELPSESLTELPETDQFSQVDEAEFSGSELCRRLGVHRTSLTYWLKQTPEKFAEWSRSNDPNKLPWERLANGRYRPIQEGIAQVNPLPEGSERSEEG